MKNVKTKIENLKDSKIKIDVVVEWDKFNEFKDKAIEKLKSTVKIDGFREGKASNTAMIAKVGEMGILQETSSLAIDSIFPEIIVSEKIKMIGHPSISVTKLSPMNPMEFSAEVSVYPEIKLPDYKKIAAKVKKETTKITEKDYEKVEENILAMHNKNNAKDSEKKEVVKKLTDEIVAKFGPFKTVADFEKQVLKDLQKEKDFENVSKHRGDIAAEILKETDFDIPEILVQSEEDKIIAQMKDDIQKMGMSYEDYLKNSGKTEDDIKKEIAPEAKNRAKIEIILKEIAQKEKISPDEKEAEKQIKTISSMHPTVDINNIKLYVENILINEAVMKFLEDFAK